LLSLFRYHARLVTRHNTLYYLPHLQFSRRHFEPIPIGAKPLFHPEKRKLSRRRFPADAQKPDCVVEATFAASTGLRPCNNPAAYPMGW
jgi:hypothetical protein